MARNEADHEDLMRDAVSLVRRIECRYSSRPEPSVVGLNELGWLFVYLGSDPMYRFDEQGRLRRAFVDGQLFRTEGRTLAVLNRKRPSESNDSSTSSGPILLRRDLSPEELEAFRSRMWRDLEALSEGLLSGVITRQHPADMNGLVDQIRTALQAVLQSKDFLAPAIVRR